MLLCFKEILLNSTAIFELWIHFSFGASALPGVVGGLILSSDNSLHLNAMIVSVSLVEALKVLEIGWNIK